MTRLEPGQVSATLRFRTTPEVVAELEALPPEERGRVLERALRLRTLYIALAGEDILLASSMSELHERARAAGLEVSKMWIRDMP